MHAKPTAVNWVEAWRIPTRALNGRNRINAGTWRVLARVVCSNFSVLSFRVIVLPRTFFLRMSCVCMFHVQVDVKRVTSVGIRPSQAVSKRRSKLSEKRRTSDSLIEISRHLSSKSLFLCSGANVRSREMPFRCGPTALICSAFRTTLATPNAAYNTETSKGESLDTHKTKQHNRTTFIRSSGILDDRILPADSIAPCRC